MLDSPPQFFETLVDGIHGAEKRIVLASLYFGRGPDAVHLVELLQHACLTKPNIKIHILMDHLRGTRAGKAGHWRKGKSKYRKYVMKKLKLEKDPPESLYPESTASLLLPLIQEFPQNVKVTFYHTPKLSGLLERIVPQPTNEVVGVQHMKAYVFDDDAIVSGANLEDNYFVNRVDRYAVFRDLPQLSDYFCGLVDTVATFSYNLCKDGALRFNKSEKVRSHGDRSFSEFAASAMESYTRHYVEKMQNSHSTDEEPTDTIAYVTMQLGQVGLRQDEEFTMQLFRELSRQRWHTILTSPYFNVTESYTRAILKHKGRFDVVVAAPRANGFFFSKGLLPKIPVMYSQMLKEFFARSFPQRADGRLRVFDWYRPGWTYHGKGLWARKQGTDSPTVVNIGSSNYGRRSVQRDLEVQVTLLTENEQLQRQFGKECRNLTPYLTPVSRETFAQPDYLVPRVWRYVAAMLKSYL